MMCNSMLAGLVAITSPCAFVTPVGAFIIGAVAGVLVVWSVFFFDKIKIDDPVGAISVHGVNGAWGLIAVGLFSDGSYGQGWNGVGATDYLGVAGPRASPGSSTATPSSWWRSSSRRASASPGTWSSAA